MNWKLDVDSQSLYVRISDVPISAQVEMPDGIVVDVDENGGAVGIEVLRTWAPWDLDAVAQRFGIDPDSVDFIRRVSVAVSQLAVRRGPSGDAISSGDDGTLVNGFVPHLMPA